MYFLLIFLTVIDVLILNPFFLGSIYLQGHVRRRLSSLIKSHRLALQSHIYGKNVLTLAMAYIEGSEFNF